MWQYMRINRKICTEYIKYMYPLPYFVPENVHDGQRRGETRKVLSTKRRHDEGKNSAKEKDLPVLLHDEERRCIERKGTMKHGSLK